MANTARQTNRRASHQEYRTRTYVDGNTVRRLQTAPKQYPNPRTAQRPAVRPTQRPASRPVSKAAQRNREKAMGMSRGFVFFLSLICAAILFTGVQFLQMKSEVTAKAKAVANLESELSTLRADNDAYYSQVVASVDLDAIRKKAIQELDMKYPSKEQVIYYQTQRSSYVRQYQDVPEAK